MKPFEINNLDHVAIYVANMEISAQWYEKVLGLETYKLPKWDPYPIFLMAGKTGVALFPAEGENLTPSKPSKEIRIEHFAFNVSNEAFQQAKKHYAQLQVEHTIKDHHYFHSIYTNDPDGHIVELTTLKVDPAEFYGQKNSD